MKTSFALVACAMICSRVLLADDFPTNLEVRLDSVPLRIVLQTYERESGIRVEVVEGVDAQITLRSDKAVTRKELLQLIQAKLEEANIALCPLSSNRVVATWIDPAKATPVDTPKPSYYQELLERRKRMVEENNRKQ